MLILPFAPVADALVEPVADVEPTDSEATAPASVAQGTPSGEPGAPPPADAPSEGAAEGQGVPTDEGTTQDEPPTEEPQAPSTQQERAEEEAAAHTVRFVAGEDATFTGDDAPRAEVEREVETGETLLAAQIPALAFSEARLMFEGWENSGSLFSSEDLLGLEIKQDETFTATFSPLQVAPLSSGRTARSMSALDIAPEDLSSIIVAPGFNGAPYSVFPRADTSAAASETALKNALFAIYQNGDRFDYTVYLGFDVTSNTDATHIARNEVPATVTAANITLMALGQSGAASKIVFTGTAADPVNTGVAATVPPAGSRTLTLNANVFAGIDLELRNIQYFTTNVYMMGRSLALENYAYATALTNYFGGAPSGDVTGSPVISVISTGAGEKRFYGGNQNGGTLTGNTSILLQNSSGPVNAVVGGALVGTVNGNTSVSITGTGGNVGTDGTEIFGTGLIIAPTSGAGQNAVFGGGYGTTPTSRAVVTGNVTLSITGTGQSAPGAPYYTVANIIGGCNFGDVGGTISTTVSGTGGNLTGTAEFVGGCVHGDVGYLLENPTAATAISNDVDTSAYTANARYFTGANYGSGTVRGNIVNRIKAGGSISSGGIMGVAGAGGRNSMSLTVLPAAMDAAVGYDENNVPQNPQAAAAAFAAQSPLNIYGNVDTELRSGMMCGNGGTYQYTMGGSHRGYLEGNTHLRVGTEGLVFSSGFGGTSMAYRAAATPAQANRGNATAYDMSGGSGHPDQDYNVFQNGDSTLEMIFGLCRWTYAGNFTGYKLGNSTYLMKGGIVDTCEAAGFDSHRVWGNSHGEVTGGEVDWFLAGGGWDDDRIYGDVSVRVTGGVINASMGGTYGATYSPVPGDGHTIFGNSTVEVYGGDFSGVAGIGSRGASLNGFSGGVTNAGTITGNVELTLDLRGSTTPFSMPTGTAITGGRRYQSGAITAVGSSAANTIVLNIFTGTGTNVLNGANIYGDGGSLAANTLSGSITINIDAPASQIGNLYATEYSNIGPGGGLLRNVTVNLTDAASVSGISGGNATDDFTDAVHDATTGGIQSVFNIGPPTQESTAGTNRIDILNTGLVNFTQLNADATLLMADGGSIKNGRGATAANHGANYSRYGNLRLQNGAGLGVVGTSIVSAAALAINGDVEITSPAGDGVINISAYTPTNETDFLLWERSGGAAATGLATTWFGQSTAYQVFTFSPTPANASVITPLNLRGADATAAGQGQTFIGDNDTTTNATAGRGYGVAIPGSFIDFEVTEGLGTIRHNVDNVSTTPTPPIAVYGTVPRDTEVTSGSLAIPYGAGGEPVLPTLTFTPDETSESWVQSLVVQRSDNTDAYELGEQLNTNPVSWTSPSAQYGYSARVEYSNQTELTAQNAIITEAQAASITAPRVLQYTAASGRPHFANNITDDLLADIRAPLGELAYRTHTVTYTAGIEGATGGGAPQQTTANITVVGSGAVFPPNDDAGNPNRSVALFARNVTLTEEAARALQSEEQLDDDYTDAVVVNADGTTAMPTISEGAVTAIRDASAGQTIPVTYSYNYAEGATLTLEVAVQVIGSYVCKIGTTGYTRLEDAVTAANAAGGATIAMLVDLYQLDNTATLTAGVTLTTASPTAPELPYEGQNPQAEVQLDRDIILFRLSGEGAALGLENIILSGNEDDPAAPLTANQPFIQLDGGQLTVGAGAQLKNYRGTAALVQINTGTATVGGGTVLNNQTSFGNGLIHAAGEGATARMESGTVTANTAANGGAFHIAQNAAFTLSGGDIVGNIATGSGGGVYLLGSMAMTGGSILQNIAAAQGGAVYHAGTLSLSGTVRLTQNTAGTDAHTENVYLANTSTAPPPQSVIRLAGALGAGSAIGVMTNTTPTAADLGTKYTIIAVPGATRALEDAAPYFTHDQLARNEAAYPIVPDRREGGTNLVLDGENVVHFHFTKVDANSLTAPLAGAEFELFVDTGPQPGQPSTGQYWQPYPGGTLTTAADGVADFGTLPQGRYLLVENIAPTGYDKPLGQWILEVDNTQANPLTFTAQGTALPPAFATGPGGELYLPNMQLVVLPMAGREGEWPYLLTGGATMLAVAAYLVYEWRKARAGP